MKTTTYVDLSNFVHKDSSFFHYKGSDTTPPCSQGHDNKGMDWIIQADVVHMTEEQWQGIHDFIGYPGNARPTQDVGLHPTRTVTFWGKNIPKSVTSLGTDW